MTFLVPLDGSPLAEAALARAAEAGDAFDEDVLAVSVIPTGNAEYARERGWLEPNEEFDLDRVVSRLHTRLTDTCPSADFRHVVVDRYAPSGTIANRIRGIAHAEDAALVFVGSENAGLIVTSLSSVGSGVAADDAYDVVIVRHRGPGIVARRDGGHRRPPKSDFYLPE
ncbi:nucleotide-binding universal stress UspA family protein [Halarchaeum solikamskense]|uniref:universal stress protein n=1 Tax=Halarchaeum nitratireducens TaxID=489913 RepID=UPI001B3A9808|nr:universal stress protein [Halarchaeum solikamskense]MBP2250595.1 nucleotide-binding universal stress UspA family protein [Halarchaeum solikamskense]